MKHSEIKSFLDEKYDLYCSRQFIETDPIQIPHQFSRVEDIEISAFLSATIAWGQRTTIISNARQLMQMMEFTPYDFLMNAGPEGLKPFLNFKHRTFNGIDAVFFIQSLKRIYKHHGGLRNVFESAYLENNKIQEALTAFRAVFFDLPHEKRTEKHVANILKNASAKRLNMFLRWMVRRDKGKVDFGLWNKINPAHLYLPLDLHTGNVARKLGLLQRTQNDWRAVEELTSILRTFDPNDPVKYDYALFGLGVFENF